MTSKSFWVFRDSNSDQCHWPFPLAFGCPPTAMQCHLAYPERNTLEITIWRHRTVLKYRISFDVNTPPRGHISVTLPTSSTNLIRLFRDTFLRLQIWTFYLFLENMQVIVKMAGSFLLFRLEQTDESGKDGGRRRTDRENLAMFFLRAVVSVAVEICTQIPVCLCPDRLFLWWLVRLGVGEVGRGGDEMEGEWNWSLRVQSGRPLRCHDVFVSPLQSRLEQDEV